MKVINLSGFGNSGNTAQADYLSGFGGVHGLNFPSINIDMSHQNAKVDYRLNKLPMPERLTSGAPIREYGILKCHYSIGGILMARLFPHLRMPSKGEVVDSLSGCDFDNLNNLSPAGKAHFFIRKELSQYLGPKYRELVEDTIFALTERYKECDIVELITELGTAYSAWVVGTNELLQKRNADRIDFQFSEVIVTLNDPPGCFPLLSAINTNGSTTAILRDPRDAAYDFISVYQLDNNRSNIEIFCKNFLDQVSVAKQQIIDYGHMLSQKYKVHRFEDFILSEKHRSKLSDMLIGNRKYVSNYFCEDESRRNINKYLEFSDDTINFIETTCTTEYLDFVEFLQEKNYFFDYR